MATVSFEIAQEIIRNKGRFMDDPPVTHVLTYYTSYPSNLHWAIVYGGQADVDLYLKNEGLIQPSIFWEAGCPTCESPETFKPSHSGSLNCESGSLASGGRNAHCTCDVCF